MFLPDLLKQQFCKIGLNYVLCGRIQDIGLQLRDKDAPFSRPPNQMLYIVGYQLQSIMRISCSSGVDTK